ncbi:ABC transporter permease [Acinetobacter larvae]|uniref:ABC transporter permease n=1 Tax=Acinetobacter larvae TaxID=1789224 RepID=A0A1B2M2P7_9GAMM|nr:ABC transporter permease [Acinetobacter larvae]AOA59465.1 ABC transporter permease [Acinetobacter larvae]
MKQQTLSSSAYHAFGTLGLLSVLLLWQIASYWIAEGFFQQFALATTLSKLVALLQDVEIYHHIAASMQRIAWALSFALVLGIPVGVLLGQSQIADALSSQVFQLLRMISPLSWMPIAVMVLGVGDQAIYFLLAFAAIWPIILNTASAVRQVDPNLLKLAHSLDATRGEILRHIVWPSIMGQILVGLRLALGIVWIVLVPSEMLGVSSGLGYFILDARDRLDYSELLSIILIIGLIGYTLDRILVAVQRH